MIYRVWTAPFGANAGSVTGVRRGEANAACGIIAWVRRFPFNLLLAAGLCLLPACRPDVVVSPPDAGERYASPFPRPPESYVEMDLPDAARSIVSGVSDDLVDGIRWADRRAVLRFHSIPFTGLRFHAAFVLPERLMRRVEAITLRVFIGGELAREAEYSEPGRHEIEKKISRGDVTWERETEVILEMVLPEEQSLPEAEARYPLSAAGFRF